MGSVEDKEGSLSEPVNAPREFVLSRDCGGRDEWYEGRPTNENSPSDIHVIEYSAYEALQKTTGLHLNLNSAASYKIRDLEKQLADSMPKEWVRENTVNIVLYKEHFQAIQLKDARIAELEGLKIRMENDINLLAEKSRELLYEKHKAIEKTLLDHNYSGEHIDEYIESQANLKATEG